MYMRLVQAKVKPDGLEMMKEYYDKDIVPALQRTAGCLYACLMRSARHPDEIISMTLWETQSHADAYEKSGPFRQLMDGAKPYLADSSEWRIQLTKEMTLEYAPVPEEPTVSSYAVSAASTANTQAPGNQAPDTYLRIVSVKLKPGKLDEFKQLYESEIIPALQATKGCRHAYLTTPNNQGNEAISLTIWDRKTDAEAYERSGLFTQLLEKTKHLYSELFQWKMHLDNLHRGQAVTSEDLQVHGYTVVTGRSFQ
jgi:quinol monooxygenase YgiN